MKPPCTATRASERLWEIASDPARVEALHGVVGDFCHLLRNRLNSLQMTLYLSRRDSTAGDPELWAELERQYKEAEGVVELFQTVCRPMPLTPIEIGLGLIVGEFAARWAPRFAAKGIAFSAGFGPSDRPSWVDPSRIGQGLEALAGWRLDRAGAGSDVSLRASVARGRSRVEWRESTPPPIEDAGELPLAAMARVASAHGGKMTQDVSDGWRVRMEWPNGGAIAKA